MAPLPTVPFCDTEISRLILGDNPLYGYSHFNRLLSQHQTEYHTPAQVLETVARAGGGRVLNSVVRSTLIE